MEFFKQLTRKNKKRHMICDLRGPTNFLSLTRKKEKKIKFCFENFQIALSQPPNVRLTFFKNLDRCQDSNFLTEIRRQTVPV